MTLTVGQVGEFAAKIGVKPSNLLRCYARGCLVEHVAWINPECLADLSERGDGDIPLAVEVTQERALNHAGLLCEGFDGYLLGSALSA